MLIVVPFFAALPKQTIEQLNRTERNIPLGGISQETNCRAGKEQ